MRALWRGELEQAEARIQEAYELGQKVDANHAVLVWSAQLGVLRRQQGRFVELEPGARGALEQHPKLVSFRCALTAMLVDDGRLDEARPLLASLAGGDFDALQEGDPNHWLNLSLLTEACVVLGESAHAGVLSARLASRRGRYVTVPHVVTLGCGSFHLANLAALRGELDEAEELLMEAVEVERRMQADPWLARSLIDLARVRLDREGSEAREAVRPLIAEAAGLVDRRGLDGVRGRLGEVARRLG